MKKVLKSRLMKRFLSFMLAAVVLSGAMVWAALHNQLQETNANPIPDLKGSATVRPTSTPTATAKQSNTVLPDEAQLNVAFTSQAPKSNWDALHEDACEEASFLTVKHYLEKTSFTKDSIDEEIIDMVHWEESQEYDKSITLNQLNTIVSQKYGYKNGTVVTGISADDIKKEIAAGRPVILGMAGKLLHNPNFKDGGPVYHMLVVTGYNRFGFITNDPGTRLGEDYFYDSATFMNALHDWDASNILNGGRNMLVFR